MPMTLRLPPELDAGLADVAGRQHHSKHSLVLRWIAEGIERAEQDDAAANEALFAELQAIPGGGGHLTGEQVAADYAAVRAERDAQMADW